MKSKSEFFEDILNMANRRPEEWRFGQAVFNYVDSMYGIARTVQFNKGIDCFYNDTCVKDFLDAAYEEYKNLSE